MCSRWEFYIGIVSVEFSFFNVGCWYLSWQRMCLGALIGFLDLVNSNSPLPIEDYCLALKDIFMDRVRFCPLVILQKSCPLVILQKNRLQIGYL